MKRWNGWGDDSIESHLTEDGIRLLTEITGEPTPVTDLSYDEALKLVKNSKLEKFPKADTSAEARLLHSRGQSFPDWLALRQGYQLAFSDAIVTPKDEGEVRQALRAAEKAKAKVVIYGGGTSVVGHINRPAGNKPVIVLDMSKMNKLIDFDPISRLAKFQAGVLGPDIEAQLAPHSMMLGHFPQSYEYSTLGGWVAARSSGQQSIYYGRIEDTFAGGRMITSTGIIDLPNHPASAAGPDLRQWWLGSEGRVGVITEATVRVRPIPEKEEFHGVFFPNWSAAEKFVRTAIQDRLPVSMMRLSSEHETFVTLALAGNSSMIKWLERYLSLRRIGIQKCLLIVGFTGQANQVSATKKKTMSLASNFGGVSLGQKLGQAWKKNRFKGPYLRNKLWDLGWGVDTLETALPWNKVGEGVERIESALHKAAATFNSEKILAYTHLSHLYNSGSALYTTYVFRLQGDAQKTFKMWQKMKSSASDAIVSLGGTISHQHGVGKDHSAYLVAEKSKEGMEWLKGWVNHADPKGMFANGSLFGPTK